MIKEDIHVSISLEKKLQYICCEYITNEQNHRHEHNYRHSVSKYILV